MPFDHWVYVSQILGSQEGRVARVCVSPLRAVRYREGCAGGAFAGLPAPSPASWRLRFLAEEGCTEAFMLIA